MRYIHQFPTCEKCGRIFVVSIGSIGTPHQWIENIRCLECLELSDEDFTNLISKTGLSNVKLAEMLKVSRQSIAWWKQAMNLPDEILRAAIFKILAEAKLIK